jgi:hypothetical protein
MDIKSFWLTWIFFWFALFLSIVAAAISLGSLSRERLLEILDKKKVIHMTAKAVHAGYDISDRILGKQLISWKAFRNSLLLSSSGMLIAYIIAAATTGGLHSFVYTAVYENVVNGNLATRESLIACVGILLFNVVMEYLYVTKSRWMLKSVTRSISLWKISAIYAVDAISTLALFMATTPLIISVFMSALSYGYALGDYSKTLSGVMVRAGAIGWYENPARTNEVDPGFGTGGLVGARAVPSC